MNYAASCYLKTSFLSANIPTVYLRFELILKRASQWIGFQKTNNQGYNKYTSLRHNFISELSEETTYIIREIEAKPTNTKNM